VRIALYHNLPPGGALRFLREVVRRSSATHSYDLYRVVDPTGHIDTPDGVSALIKSVNDIPYRWHWHSAPARLVNVRNAIELAALWDAEARIARAIDAGGYDLCFVNSCRVTHSPSLLTRLETPTLYFAQEPRRQTFERELRKTIYSASTHLRHKVLMHTEDALLAAADRRAAAAASVLACNSIFSAETLYWAYARTARVVPLGVDTELFRPSGTSRDDYVLSVGALDPVKGFATIIEALGMLPAARRPALKLAFERRRPGYDSCLLDLAKRQGVRLELCQGVADAQLVNLYSSAIATVCAARLEPFGLTPLESLSCGTPVVAINEGGYRESVADGINGVLVAPTREGLAGGIDAVIAGRLTSDPGELRASVGERTWDSTVANLHRLFRTLPVAHSSV